MIDSLQCGRHRIGFDRPVVMGILNTTPDSFSDGGLYLSPDEALERARQMQREGAAIIDVGGESTRPGADAVSVQQELERVIPVIERLSTTLDIAVSVDTSKAAVMQAAVAAGAGMINDVMALRAENALETVAGFDNSIAVCLMHMQGEPRSMQHNPHYANVVTEVYDFLEQRLLACSNAGINAHRLVIDPGFGFGKTLEHNLALLQNLSEFGKLRRPVLAGISRKSMLGKLLGDVAVDQRVAASVAAAVLAYERGARIIRVHDVKQTVDALQIADAIL